MSIVTYENDSGYLHTNDDLSLNDIVNVDIVGKNSNSNMITLDNTNQSTSRPEEDGNWNLELTVYNVGLQCAPDSKFFKVPPCTGPYPNYNLTITTSDGKNICIKTNSNGKFKTLLKPGSYVITAAPTIKSTYFTIEQKNVTRLNLLTSDKGLE